MRYSTRQINNVLCYLIKNFTQSTLSLGPRPDPGKQNTGKYGKGQKLRQNSYRIYQNNYIHFFVGFNAEKTSTQNLDDLEEIEVFLSSVEEAEKFAAEGKMKDTGSVLALFLLKEYLKSN